MTNNVEYNEIMAFHPGYYIQETIEDLEITQEEFAIRLGTTAKTISKLVNGEINLSNDIAHKLSNMLGTSVELWLNLQTTYEKKLIEINEARQLDRQKNIAYMIDYEYFVGLGLVTEARKIEDKIINLRQFFQISSLDILLTPDFLVNFRTATQCQKAQILSPGNKINDTSISTSVFTKIKRNLFKMWSNFCIIAILKKFWC